MFKNLDLKNKIKYLLAEVIEGKYGTKNRSQLIIKLQDILNLIK